MEYEFKYDTFVFDDQCDDLLHISILASIFNFSFPSLKAPPNMLSSSSLKLKLLLDILKYAFFGPIESFPIIITNDLDLDQETQVLDFLKENKEALGWTLEDI